MFHVFIYLKLMTCLSSFRFFYVFTYTTELLLARFHLPNLSSNGEKREKKRDIYRLIRCKIMVLSSFHFEHSKLILANNTVEFAKRLCVKIC